MKNKKEKLEQLDELVLDKMINILDSHKKDTLDQLSALTPAINYLRNNQMVAEKPKNTIEEDIQKRLKEAAKRRAKKESL